MKGRPLACAAVLAVVVCGSVFAESGAPAQFDRATRLALAGDAAGARRQYEDFLTRNPDDRLAPVAAMAIANLFLSAERDTQAALDAYRRVAAIDRDGGWAPGALRAQAACAEARKQWGAAGDLYMEALSRAPAGGASAMPDSWFREVTERAGSCYDRTGDPSRGVAAAERLLSIAPSAETAAVAEFRLGTAYAAQGDSARAAAHLRRLIESYPTSPLLAASLARRVWISKHESLDWAPYLAYARGSDLIAARRYEEALANADSVLSGRPGAVLAQCAEYRKITLETLRDGDYVEGCRRLDLFLQEHPDSPRRDLARTTVEESWRPIAELQQQTRSDPADGETWGILGASLLQMRSPRAAEALEKAVALRPGDEAAHLNLGYAYGQAGRSEEAVREYRFYLDRHPDDTLVLNLIGYNCLAAGDATASLPYFQRYAQLAPEDPNSHDSLGEGYLSAGRIEEAAREYETAVRLNADFSNSHFMLGTIYERLGRTEQAIASFERFLELVPSGPQAAEAQAGLERLRAAGSGQR
ncbi:MAG: tetratricopeptide repeat protein [Candidatus Eisenbacteria bacterium]